VSFGKNPVYFLFVLMFACAIIVGCSVPAAKTSKNGGAALYPNQNINGIIVWGAGGGTDQVARIITPAAEKTLGRSVILNNKTGATGAIGTQFVKDQKADGYTLLFSAENPQIYPVLGISKLTYDDFEPIILTARGSTVIIVRKDSPYNTFQDLIDAARENPGRISIGTSGVGGQPYVSAAILKKMEDVEFNHIFYDGDGPLITALLGGQIHVTGAGIGAAAQYIRNGDVKALAIMSNAPNPALPEVPHITGIDPKYEEVMKASGFFYGVFVRKETPEDIVIKLREAFKVGFQDPKFQEYVHKNGLTPMGITGDEARQFMKNWQSIVAWLIYDAGGAKESPEKFNIPKPAI
jgi:tripartite-type tricarboxylate transporter receptor subunit TctC